MKFGALSNLRQTILWDKPNLYLTSDFQLANSQHSFEHIKTLN